MADCRSVTQLLQCHDCWADVLHSSTLAVLLSLNPNSCVFLLFSRTFLFVTNVVRQLDIFIRSLYSSWQSEHKELAENYKRILRVISRESTWLSIHIGINTVQRTRWYVSVFCFAIFRHILGDQCRTIVFLQVFIQRCWSEAFWSSTDSKWMLWRWNDGNFISSISA